jgi:NADPH-dependent curcumin reductase CurA
VAAADPYLRGMIKSGRTAPGSVMSGFVAGKIVASSSPEWVVGDLFGAHLPFTTVQAVGPAALAGLRKLTGVISEENISYGIGVLGMPGS